ncbi:MAG: glycosyltransferase [Micavibrio sp.]
MTLSTAKIVFILPDFQAGGAERVMITIANHINRQKYKPLIIALNERGPLRSLVATDVPVLNLSSSSFLKGIAALVSAIKKEKVDIAFSTMAHMNIMLLIARFALPGVPVLVREAVTPSYFSNNVFKSFVLKLSYYCLYPFAARIYSPTKLVFDEMPSVLGPSKLKLQRIFNPVNKEVVCHKIEKDFRSEIAGPHQKLFVSAGRLVSQKGFDNLIEALHAWSGRDDWRLLIMGDGPDRDKLDKMVSAYNLHQISLMGFESDPWKYMAVADAFLLPSRYEGLPNVVLESLTLGVPVIASATAGGIVEIAEVCDAAALSIAKDMKEFIDLMSGIQAKDDLEVRECLLPDCFSLSYVIEQYENSFDAVLNKEGREACVV